MFYCIPTGEAVCGGTPGFRTSYSGGTRAPQMAGINALWVIVGAINNFSTIPGRPLLHPQVDSPRLWRGPSPTPAVAAEVPSWLNWAVPPPEGPLPCGPATARDSAQNPREDRFCTHKSTPAGPSNRRSYDNNPQNKTTTNPAAANLDSFPARREGSNKHTHDPPKEGT